MGICGNLSELARKFNYIDPSNYTKFDVKRGLRNDDGTGVLVGLTTVGEVEGYVKQDGHVTAIPGKLYYRGIEVEDLVAGFEREGHFGFEETVFLLIFGRLPTRLELEEFTLTLGEMRILPKNFSRDVLQTFRTPDIMNALGRSTMVLYSRDKRADDLSLENQIRQGLELCAKLVPLVPWAYYSVEYGFRDRSLIIHMPEVQHSAAETFLRLLRPNMEFTELEAKTLDVALVLHAEHGGGNNSTFTMRVVSSTGTDFYSAATAALGSLKGPLHGGANVQVVKMFEEVKRDVTNWHSRDEVRDWIQKLLKKEKFDQMGVLYGFGHAVYTISDPRAVILKKYARKLAIEKGREEELELYELFEEEAPKVLKEMGKGSKEALCANVDFYSGFVYDCLGIPPEVFTPLFAMARMAGWAAHRIEMLTGPLKIVRPAFKYVGELAKAYELLNERRCPDAVDTASVLAR